MSASRRVESGSDLVQGRRESAIARERIDANGSIVAAAAMSCGPAPTLAQPGGARQKRERRLDLPERLPALRHTDGAAASRALDRVSRGGGFEPAGLPAAHARLG